MLFLRRGALALSLLAATALHAADSAKKAGPSTAVKSPTVPKLRGTPPDLRMPTGTATEVVATDFKLEPITLQEALGRAFEHNLEARFDKVDIKISAARVRFAAGAFAPVFSTTTSR